MTNQAYLIEIFNNNGELYKRRISLSIWNAEDWVDEFARKNNATVNESTNTIVSSGNAWTYKITNIKLV